MAFSVRIFAYDGITQIHQHLPKQYSADSVFVLDEPYKWSQVISVSGVAASSAPNNTTRVQILRVEVPDGSTVRYEINPPNRTGGVVAAGNASPRLSGFDQFAFAPGWSISLVDAASFP